MPNITSVTLTSGVPTAGTGTVGTLDNVTGTAGAPSVPVLTVQGVASGTAQPVSGTVAATQSGTWTVQPGNTANTTAWKVDGSAVTQPVSIASLPSGAVTNAGTFAVQNNAATPAGTNTIGSVKITDGTNTATVNLNGQATMVNSSPVVIASNQTVIPVSTNTASTGKLIAANTTNATSLKASAGTLQGIQVFNNSATIGYLKLYNKASAPTVGTDTPVKVIMIPASSGAVIPNMGLPFAIGIAYAVTGGIADADTTAVAASAFIINIDYV